MINSIRVKFVLFYQLHSVESIAINIDSIFFLSFKQLFND